MIARLEDMPPFKRLNTRRPNSVTSTIVRTNLRRVREMQGLTRDQAIARIEQPTITTTALGKAETGDRNITAIELAQLAVAYQTPVQSFFVPWGNQRSATPSLSGADFRTGLRESKSGYLVAFTQATQMQSHTQALQFKAHSTPVYLPTPRRYLN